MDLSQRTRAGEWAVLIATFPEYGAEPIGVVVRDITDDRLEVKLRDNWWVRFSGEGSDLWSGLAADIRQQAHQMGANNYLNWFEATPPHILQIGLRRNIYFRDSAAALERLYKTEVERAAPISSDSLCTDTREAFRLRTILAGFKKATSCAVSFVSAKSPFKARLQYVLLGGLLVGTAFVRLTNHPTVVTPQFAAATIPAVELPALDHQTIFALNLKSFEDDASRRHNSSRLRPRKALVSQQINFSARRTEAVDLDPPPSYSNSTSTNVPTSVAILPALPTPPRYRSHNRLINILSKLASPFKEEPHGPPPTKSPEPKSRSGSSAFTDRVGSL